MGILTNIAKFFKGENKRAFQPAKLDRLTSSWSSSQTNINYDIRSGNRILRARARDLAENDPYARKFLRMLEKNVIGPAGFSFQNKAYDWKKVDGESKKVYDKYANSVIEEAWAEWSRKENCTITRDMTLREATAVELKTIATDGEIFLLKITGKNAGNKFGFTYQQIDPALCDEGLNKTLPNGNQIIMGIEYDPYLRAVAYYFIKPGTSPAQNPGYYFSRDYIRIPAERIIHLFRREFVGQLRGISWFLPSAWRMKILSAYQEAVLINARSAALKTMVLTPKDASASLEAADVAGGEEDSDGDIIQELEPGMTYIVPQGYEADAFDPSYPSGSEGPFTQAILQAIASGWDVDYPTLASNFKDVNYTSSRAALLDARAGYQTIQEWLINHKMLDVFQTFLEMAILSGAINLPIEKFDKFNKPLFLGYRGEWVDPYKEANADSLALKNNLETYERILGRRGYTLEEFIEQRKAEKKLFEDAGLSFDAEDKGSTENGNLQGEGEKSQTFIKKII